VEVVSCAPTAKEKERKLRKRRSGKWCILRGVGVKVCRIGDQDTKYESLYPGLEVWRVFVVLEMTMMSNFEDPKRRLGTDFG
jgi:hypothetical protein